MDRENLKNNDPIQLQQMIIFLKAELAKYKYEVDKYKNGNYHALEEKFVEDKEKLTKEKNELVDQLVRLNEEFERQKSEYEERFRLQEMQLSNYINRLDAMENTETNIQMMNEKLTKEKNELVDQLVRLNEEFERQKSEYEERFRLQEIQLSNYINRLDAMENTETNIQMMNEKLTKEKNELVDQLVRLKEEFERQKNEYEERFRLQEIQLSNYINRLDAMENTETNIQMMNEKLTKEKNELVDQLVRLKEEFERQKNEYEERLRLQEIQLSNYIKRLEVMENTETNIEMMNEKLTEVMNRLNDSLDQQIADSQITLNQLENRLVHHIQESINLITSQIENLDLTNKENLYSEKVMQDLLNEIEEKNNAIWNLQLEVADLKERNEKYLEDMLIAEKNLKTLNESQVETDNEIDSVSTKPAIDVETLFQLELQIKEVLDQSLNYKEKLEAKLLVIDALELKLNQLIEEMNEG